MGASETTLLVASLYSRPACSARWILWWLVSVICSRLPLPGVAISLQEMGYYRVQTYRRDLCLLALFSSSVRLQPRRGANQND